jgi:hypothetical protein
MLDMYNRSFFFEYLLNLNGRCKHHCTCSPFHCTWTHGCRIPLSCVLTSLSDLPSHAATLGRSLSALVS